MPAPTLSPHRDAAPDGAAGTPPLLPQRPPWRVRLALAAARAALGATLLVSPRPGAALVRRAFAAGGARTAAGLARHRPDGVATRRDERYGDGPDALLDVHRPAAATAPLPALVWVHGGGWVGGAKEELRDWLALVASHGYAVVAVRYPLAPAHRYPAPVRAVSAALAHVERHAGRLGIDPARLALGGDSAGAQIAAQVAALATTPGYAEAVGVRPTVAPDRLRGVVLACGPYDLGLLHERDGDPLARRLVRTLLWAYSGTRDYARDRFFATASVADHLSGAFPPTLATVGNADPLRRHTEVLVARLRALGVDVDALLFTPDHAPPLGHEYQFDLDGAAGQAFLARLLAFLARRLRDGA